MNRKNNSRGGGMVGTSSLFIIFSVLCLTVFAVLSLGTASAGKRVSERSAASVGAYYNAECEANRILSELRSGICREDVTCSGNIYSYSCKISDTAALFVEVEVNSPDDYYILRWQSEATVEFDYDDDINVWDGETDDINES